jgi:hypothetical protein
MMTTNVINMLMRSDIAPAPLMNAAGEPRLMSASAADG